MGWVTTSRRCPAGVSHLPREQKSDTTAFDRREALAPLHPTVLRVQQSRQDIPQFNGPQERVRRLRLSVLPMLSQDVIADAELVDKLLCMGSSQDARYRPALPDTAPPLSFSLPSLLDSVSPPLLFLWPGAGGGSLPPARGIRPRLVAAPLPVLFCRDSRPDPRGRPRLPLVAGAPPSVPVDIDAVAPGVAAAALGYVMRTPERPSDVTSLPPAIWGFSVARSAASPASI